MSPLFSYIFSGLAVLAVVYLIFYVYRLINATADRERIRREQMMTGFPINLQSDITTKNEDSDNSPETQSDGVEHIKIGCSSVVGTRKNQQDTVMATDEAYLQNNNFKRGMAILCDGMGGLSGGELASFITAKTLHDDFVIANPENIPEFFKAEVLKTDEIVYGLQDDMGKRLGAGSTLVSVVIDGNKLYWVSVGDSRIYIVRNSEITQITEDHNYFMVLKENVENGLLTEEEAMNDPRADALVSFIGIGKESRLDVNEEPFVLQNGDIILLCSDGIYKTLSEQKMTQILLQSGQNPTALANTLTQAVMAENKRGQDNASAAVVKYYQ